MILTYDSKKLNEDVLEAGNVMTRQVELLVPENLKQKGVTYIRYGESYGLAIVNGTEVLFRIYDDWQNTHASILYGFNDSGQHLIMDFVLFIEEEHRKRRESKMANPVLQSKPIPKQDARLIDTNLINQLSSLISGNPTLCQVKSSEIWSRLIQKLDGHLDEHDKNMFHSSEYGIIYKNTTVPRILRSLGAQHRHTSTGGTWVFQATSTAQHSLKKMGTNLEELFLRRCDVCGKEYQDYWYCLMDRRAEVLKCLCIHCTFRYLAPKPTQSLI